MPPDEITRCVPLEEVEQLELESAGESELNDVLILFLETASVQLTSGQNPRLARMKSFPVFVFRTRPQSKQDEELLDFKLCLDVLKAKNKQLTDITTRIIECLLTSLEPKLEEHIASLNIAPLETVEAQVAYRWNNRSGGTGYHPSLGFYCGQWKFRQESEFEPRSFNDIGAFRDHLSEPKIASPWISMIHTPGQMLEIVRQDWGDEARDLSHQVHIIDLRKLKLLNPHITTTQNLANGMMFEDYYHYRKNPFGRKGISYHHWLCQQWIPACCILGFVTIEDFRGILSDNNIRYVPNHKRKLGEDWVDTKILSINMWKTHFAGILARHN